MLLALFDASFYWWFDHYVMGAILEVYCVRARVHTLLLG